MKTNPEVSNDDLRPEYDFTAGVRGKDAARFAAGSNVVLEPDVAAAFPDAAAVNHALRRAAGLPESAE